MLAIVVTGVVADPVWPQAPGSAGHRERPRRPRDHFAQRAPTTTTPSLTVPGGPIIMPTTGTATSMFSIGTDVTTLAFSVDGKLLATEEFNLL